MTLAYLYIVKSLFIPLACAAYAKFSVKGYNNKNPREFLAKLEGRAQRANYAQNNFYETFPAFGIGVVVAHQLGALQWRIELLAITYFFARVLYAVFYIYDKHILRSIAWFIAFSAIIALYFVGN